MGNPTDPKSGGVGKSQEKSRLPGGNRNSYGRLGSIRVTSGRSSTTAFTYLFVEPASASIRPGWFIRIPPSRSTPTGAQAPSPHPAPASRRRPSSCLKSVVPRDSRRGSLARRGVFDLANQSFGSSSLSPWIREIRSSRSDCVSCGVVYPCPATINAIECSPSGSSSMATIL